MSEEWDTIIVGGGIVGLATAWELMHRCPDQRILVLDKERVLASHQTGHNSGVIHSGLYYRSGSLKARLCVQGRASLLKFLDVHGIPYELSGKVVVAVRSRELANLKRLYEQGQANGVQGLALIGAEQLRKIEPNVRGIAAIHSPFTGIVNYRRVAEAMAEDLQQMGHHIALEQEVDRVDQGVGSVVVHLMKGHEWRGRHVIVAAGLQSDRLAMRSGLKGVSRIIPFRGDYLVIKPSQRQWIRSMVYPVPDPNLPFLGVHFTKKLDDGSIWIGPNAVLAGARELYQRAAITKNDAWDIINYRGFWRMARQYWRTGFSEMYRDMVLSAFIKTAQDYVPEINVDHVKRGPIGIRAQMVDSQGHMTDDFDIIRDRQVLFVQNAPSPAATSSLAIARYIIETGAKEFGWHLTPSEDLYG